MAEQVNVECTNSNCLCWYIMDSGDRKAVNFSAERNHDKGNVKHIYIEKLVEFKNIPRKNLTIHHYTLHHDVDHESKSCHLVRRYNWRDFLKVCFENNCPPQIVDKVLRAGFSVVENGDKRRNFSFFGHSASQQREGICVMYDMRLGDWGEIIGQFGKFEKIKNVSKFSARIGLLLSTTIEGITLTETCVTKIDDVERNGFCFTDGCGLVSYQLAERLTEQLRQLKQYKNLKHTPSVFQFRFKGCKGTVALNSNSSNGVEMLFIRNSNEKFEWKLSKPYYLGVVDDGVSRPYTYGHLNKQFIQLLSANGIQDDTFLQIQEKYFRELESLETDFELALKYLCFEEKWDLAERLSETRKVDETTKKALENIRGKFKQPPSYEEENRLNKKAEKTVAKKLKIPIWDSRNMFGVCDQTETLKYGEVFVRVTENGRPKTLEDGTKVVVMRSPSYSAGDCRILKCRNVANLDHLIDCVVFPTNGDRPHPDEMSGGDLDGDRFFVCWDSRLVPRKVARSEVYKGGEGRSKPNGVTREDCILNFANYDRCILGSISNLFDKWASSSSTGINSVECKILNLRFTKAVDSAKSGEKVFVNDLKSPPPELQGSAQKVWSKMEKKADDYVNSVLELTHLVNCLEFDEFLTFVKNPPSSLSEFQKFRLAYKYCKQFSKMNEFEQICRHINFNAFTSIQKQLLPLDLNFDTKNISNELYKSNILLDKDIESLDFNSDYPWSLYYKSTEDQVFNWDVFRNVLEKQCNKLVVLHFLIDCRSWVIVMLLTETVPLDEASPMKDWTIPAKFHFFQHGAQFEHKNWRGERDMQIKDYLIEIRNRRFEIYDGVKPHTFILMKEDDDCETVTSIDFNQFIGGEKRASDKKLRKERCLNCEIFIQYPSVGIAPLLLQPKFYDDNTCDLDCQPIKFSDEEIQEYLFSSDDFPLVTDVENAPNGINVPAKNPVKTAEAILKQNAVDKEVCQENISILYQALLGTPQCAERIAASLVYYLWKHNARLADDKQYARVLVEVLRYTCTIPATESIQYLSSLNETTSGDAAFYRVKTLIKNMHVAELQFSASTMKTIFELILTSMNDRPDTVRLMIRFLQCVAAEGLLPIAASDLGGESYFLNFASLVTMESLNELHESLVTAQAKRMTTSVSEKIYVARASDIHNGRNQNSADGQQRSNPNSLYKLTLTSACDSFKVGSAINLSPVQENEKRPKFQMGYVAEIVKYKQSETTLIVRGVLPNPHPLDRIIADKYWRIDLITNLVPYYRTMNALQFLCYNPTNFDVPPVMLPLIQSFNRTLPCHQISTQTDVPDIRLKLGEENCNESQTDAIIKALANEISLVQGPPGTGKTKTGALIVKYWIELGFYPILCVAETNEAVNNLCLAMIEKGMHNDIIRYSSSGILPEAVKKISLDEIYRERFQPERVHEDYFDSKKVEALLKEKKVVAITCKGAGRDTMDLTDKESRKWFKAILVDEAAQVVEPTILIPLHRSRCERLCLIGDDMQLPPLVKLDEAKSLAASLFERLTQTKLFSHVMLNKQYRMHPFIASFPSTEFYGGRLENGVLPKERRLIDGFDWPNGQPVCFVEVPDKESEKSEKTSKFNQVEAQMLVEILKNILEAGDVKAENVGIITPYAAQQRKIKELLSDKKISTDVNTVDGFQGQERDLILVSTVRNRDCIGFLVDKRRNNVLLTRSKRGLIVFGCQKTLCSDAVWNECPQNNTVGRGSGRKNFHGRRGRGRGGYRYNHGNRVN